MARQHRCLAPSFLFSSLLLCLRWISHPLPLVAARDCARHWRRAWRDLTCEEQDEFLDAIELAKDDGVFDDFATIHNWHADSYHLTEEFLPWHRWFLYNLEKALQDLTGKCVYVPYWDWERDAGSEESSAVFHPDTFGSYGGVENMGQEGLPHCTTDGRFDSRTTLWWETTELDGATCLQRAFPSGLSFSGEAQILALIANFEQYEDTTDGQDPDLANGFRAMLEGVPHAQPHHFVAGNMETNYAPVDPLFYVHHSNVDRIWAMWQDYWDHDRVDTSSMRPPYHYGGDLLDVPMRFDMDGIDSWDFRMEDESGNRFFPTPRDVMNIAQPHLSIRYQNDYLASVLPDYEPNPEWFQAAETDVRDRCDRSRSSSRIRRLHLPASMEDETDLGKDSDLGGDTQPHETTHNAFARGDASETGTYTNIFQQYQTRANADLPIGCRQTNQFSRLEDQEKWGRLCRSMPFNTTVAERLALLAEEDCQERWHKLTDADVGMMKMRMSMGIASFACFHRPDRL